MYIDRCDRCSVALKHLFNMVLLFRMDDTLVDVEVFGTYEELVSFSFGELKAVSCCI
jgi:hypothetical protein